MTQPSELLPAERDDLLQAVGFARVWFDRWSKRGLIQADQHRLILDEYADLERRLRAGETVPAAVSMRAANFCWSCDAEVPPSEAACANCGAPARTGDATALRYLVFLCHEVERYREAGRLTLAAHDDCLAEVRARMAATRGRLDRERVPLALAADVAGRPPVVAEALPFAAEEPPQRPSPPPYPERPIQPPDRRTAPPRPPKAARRNLLEVLLDPHSIQWLLGGGGALLVLGLLIWLWAEGIFENPVFVASLLGAANAALLVGGWALIRLTRHETAGRALTLLACLVMPFNLWFYHAQGLITLSAGGHLWIPALVCCILYAISARLLRDPTFVYVLAAGVAGTGLLLLADIGFRFWDVSAPSTLLVVLGFLFIHAERLFLVYDGPFSRKRFGIASFVSGHVLLGAGLLLLLGAQLTGDWLWPFFASLYSAVGGSAPPIVTEFNGQLLALGLVLVGTYLYAYSDLVVRRNGIFIHVAVGALLWAEVLLIRMFVWPIPLVEVVIIALALTGLLANLALTTARAEASPLMRAGPALALGLSIVPVVLGVVEHYQASAWHFKEAGPSLSVYYVVAMLVTAVACRIGAFLYRHRRPGLSLTYFFGTGAATLVGAAGLLLVAFPERRSWEFQAPLLMVIPLLYIVAARLYGTHTAARSLVWVAHGATAVMLLSSIGTAVQGFVIVKGNPLNIALAGFFAEAALFYGLEGAWRRHAASIYACTISASAAVWQLLKYWSVTDEYYLLCFALLGLILLIAYRFAVLERARVPALAKAAFHCANALLIVAFIGGALMTLTKLAQPQHQPVGAELSQRQEHPNVLLGMTGGLAAISLLAITLVRQPGLRRWYAATTITHTVLFLLVFAILSGLTLWQRVEIVCVALGTCLLVAGHVGWYREQEEHTDLVSLGLVMGSLLVMLPLTGSVIVGRLAGPFGVFHTINEIGMLAGGLLLLATGVVLRIRSTTVTGAIMTALWLLTLVLYISQLPQLQTAAVYIMIGGGLFFLIGVLLSLYRDRLLKLPERIKRREGIFKVLSWR